MRFIVNGAEYEAASLERITGTDAIALLREAGFGVQTLARRILALREVKDVEDILEDADRLTALLAFVWLSRRVAGEHTLTFAEACGIEILSLQIVVDTDDTEPEDDAADPTGSPASDPDAGAPAA